MLCEEEEQYDMEVQRREHNIIKSFLFDPVSHQKVGTNSKVSEYLRQQDV